MKKVFITGIAGFIGFHLAQRMKSEGWEVNGIDNFNPILYDNSIKHTRAKILKKKGVVCEHGNLAYVGNWLNESFDLVVHLAAHPGIRSSAIHAVEYMDNNIVNTQRLIESCQKYNIDRVVFASSSSVYGDSNQPWTETTILSQPKNHYALTKITNEAQFELSNIKRVAGLRFFTVFGPWGRPDMAVYDFANKIVNNEEINLFVDMFNCPLKRDFTYIDDIIDGVMVNIEFLFNNTYRLSYVINIGSSNPLGTDFLVELLEEYLDKKAKVNLLKAPSTEALSTCASTGTLEAIGWERKVSFENGIKEFVNWYKGYHKVK